MQIAIWGPKGSGKTTYLTRIYMAALQKGSPWKVRCYDHDSHDFVSESVEAMIEGNFPPPNDPNQPPKFYQYEFLPDQPKNFLDWLGSVISTPKPITVSFADVAGERYINDPIDSPLWEHLANSDGIICLLDPLMDDHFKITNQLLDFLLLKLRDSDRPLKKGRIPHNIAFCFSKIDRPELIRVKDNPRKLIESVATRMGGISLNKLLDNYVDSSRLNYFTVSSIGKNVTVNGNTIEDPQYLSQINIFKPIRWLFNQTQN